MRRFKKAMALLCALTLLVTCTIAGLALPVSAEGDTFKLAVDEYYMATTDSGGYVVYGHVPVLNMDGTPYTGNDLKWTLSNNTVSLGISEGTGRFATNKDQKQKSGSAVVTATNAAGESHSCTVYVTWDGEGVSLGDFEHSTVSTLGRWTGIIGTSKGSVELDPDDSNNHVLAIPSGTGTLYYTNLSLQNGTNYIVSFDAKGDTGEVKGFWTSAKASTVFGSSKTSYNKNGDQYITPKADRWTHYEFYITTAPTGSTNTGISQRSYMFAFKNLPISTNTKKGTLYIDNVSFRRLGTAESVAMNATEADLEIGDELQLSVSPTPSDATFNRVQWSSDNEAVASVDKNGKVTALGAGVATITAKSGVLTTTCSVTVHEEMLAAVPDVTLQNGAIETIGGAFGEVQPEDVVTVNVTPEEGYLMVPGSLRYTNKAGETVHVLNKDFTDGATFGEGEGNTFQFVMPNEKVVLTADFVSVTEQNFAANTIGTSCRYTLDENDEKVYDGIRFLTRLNLANKFDDESNTLTVTYGGAEYTVLEFGSLLKREQNTTKLTYDNAVANAAAAGVNRMWISKAYTKDSGNFVLVDYTESYLDFTSVMLTNFYDRFYTARGYIRLQAADESVVTLEFDEITNSISSVVPILPPVQTLEGVTVNKTSQTPVAHTVAPGEKITYQIDVTAGDKAGTVTVFEPIPANTVYVEGADELVGKTAVWTVELAANETKSLTYTVQINDSMELCNGGTVEETDTQVGNTTVDGDETLYIERTVNKGDEYYVNKAVQSLADSSYKDLTYVHFVYAGAFTSSMTGYRTQSGYSGYTAAQLLDSVLNGDGSVSYSYKNSSNKDVTATNNHKDNIAPTLYGGTQVKGAIEGLKGAPAASVSEKDLMIGDVVIVKNDGAVSLYIYCNKGLMKIKTTGGAELADMAVLDTLTSSQAYVVLRTRTALTGVTSYDLSQQPAADTYSDAQKALVDAAEAFFMRGEKVQYADTSLASYADYRWAKGLVSPEDATAISWKYTNCAAFCYDSYYFGLGYALGSGNMYTTEKMAANTTMRVFNLDRDVSTTYTDEEKADLQEQWMSTLQPGDLMVVRRSSGSGHVMLYIGNGKMLHSSGSNFNYTYSREIYEPSIRYGQVIDYFFNPTSLSGYLFGDAEKQSSTQVTQACIIRPLSKFTGDVPENAINRQANLKGVVAQKVASHTMATTVTAGDTITYTYRLRNTNDVAVTLEVKDVVPENTTYISGGDTHIDGELAWTVTVPANETREVSFTVRVNADVAKDTMITSKNGTVGGVKFTVRDIMVANTLTTEQREAIVEAFNELLAEGTTLKNFELANEIYKRALGVENVFTDTDAAVVGEGESVGVFVSTSDGKFSLAESGTYREMLAPTLWGGRAVKSTLWDQTRSRLPKEEQLVIGDILLRRTSSATTVYMYVGGSRLVSLTSSGANDSYDITYRLEGTLLATGNYFAVLRPSMTMEVAE